MSNLDATEKIEQEGSEPAFPLPPTFAEILEKLQHRREMECEMERSFAIAEAIASHRHDSYQQRIEDAETDWIIYMRCHRPWFHPPTKAVFEKIREFDRQFIAWQAAMGHPVESRKVRLGEIQDSELFQLECAERVERRRLHSEAEERAEEKKSAEKNNKELRLAIRQEAEALILDLIAAGVLHVRK